ncbi:hypothetical protein A6A40_14650 [Azospirillum humicireducens]|uniref:HNH endonuclease n=1 Tax=Azospirillum humicireducens TaxID=1226968 RepID=A0A2R4VPI5_9PROT|nr:hypothetical protein [Azospirillum humicireducens]AWB06353.1 hypothetical protein A6A40_14650 [Azospirillum humicireducens]
MNICYLTGKTLKAKRKDLQEDESESLEHIIPNALGGKLSSLRILSHKANQDLNDLIDKRFVKIFEGFCLRLEIEKDRKTTSSLRAVHDGYNVDVVLKNNRYYPRKPFFDPDKKAIYADSQKTGENYKTYLIKKGDISESEEVEIFDDISGEFKIGFSLDNSVFSKGIAKISAGFATFHGVPRDNIIDVIDIKNHMFHDKLLIAPSIPMNGIEAEFEEKVQKSHYYPVHGLVLYGSKEDRILYCYVELFSAFQWYVMLDSDYNGEDIHRTYTYSIIDGSEISLDDYIGSLLTGDEASSLLKTYKIISRQNFIELNRSSGTQKTKNYTFSKFNALSSFSNYVFITKKAKLIGLDLNSGNISV